MFSRYDELELLALIEGDLEPTAERSLRERLAGDPEAAALIDAMVRDRALLRSEGEPVMPADLSSRVEQALTRPMLIAAWGEDECEPQPMMTSRPGEFRRRHNHAIRVRRAVRFSMAASVGLLLVGGLWMGINTALNLRGERDPLIAQLEAERAESALAAQRSTPETWPPSGAAIHHYAPQPVLESHLALAAGDLAPRPLRDASAAVAVDFALVLRGTTDPTLAESHIEGFIVARGFHVALVQNFDFDAAIRLERDRLVAGGDPRRQVGPPHRNGGRAAAQHQPRHLAGPRDIAASPQQQMDYAARGATHTITIRLSELQVFLEEVDRAEIAHETSLKPLPQRDVEAIDASWSSSIALVREVIAKLEQTGDDPLIHLPIVIE